MSDFRAARRERLRDLMERHGAGALVLRSAANFAWYTGGAENRVDMVSPLGVADILLTHDAEYVLTNRIEAARMRDEQTPGFEVLEHDWFAGEAEALREASGGAPLAADFALADARDLSAEIAPLRYVLDAEAIECLRAVGADARAAMDEAIAAVRPGMSEHEAAAELAAACRRRGLFGSVLLAATHERIAAYRHPLPTSATLERRAMLVTSAERGGLYANTTRIVWFDEPDPEIERRQAACDEILRRMREEATRPGRTLADAFADCTRFYAEAGFDGEWKHHHQGGSSGYGSREVIANPTTDTAIETGMAFAWNPSITGAKAEETLVLTEAGPEVVT